MLMKIIDQTGVHSRVNIVTVFLRPRNQNKSHFINEYISRQLLTNYPDVCGDIQEGQSGILRKWFYLHLFARENKDSFLSFCFARIPAVLLSQPEVKSKRKMFFPDSDLDPKLD